MHVTRRGCCARSALSTARMPSAAYVSSSACSCGLGRVSRRRVRCAPYANASLASESARPIAHHEAAHGSLRKLFLRPARLAKHWSAAEPRAADEFARRVKLLRRAPAKLTTDDLGRTQDARRARARPGRDADPSKRIGERAHLLVP